MPEPFQTERGDSTHDRSCVAFASGRRLARGDTATVTARARAALKADPSVTVLAFDEITSEPVELDLRDNAGSERRRTSPDRSPDAPRGPGRPRLGVMAREVTLLPRHWDWLAAQPGGASVALRRLVEAARRQPDPAAAKRAALESAYRFMSAMAGNERGFEEATRALFRGSRGPFARETASWPADIRAHARRLARRAFAGKSR